MTRVRLVCGNCGCIEFFDSWDAAFQAGWDTVERFGYTACDKCPGVSVIFPMHFAHQARDRSLTDDQRQELLDKAAQATLDYDPNKS